MATHQPVYRMTVYAPRSVDATEATILTPAAGAPHSDSFKVITKQGVAGWQPYLGEITGRRGSIDPVTKKSTTGQMRIRVMDPRTAAGGSQASRWSTAYTGDTKERPALLGCKVYVEESLDNGSTFAAFFVGRVVRDSLDHPLWRELECRDFAEDFRQIRAFGGRPHSSITYDVEPLAAPLGLSAAYGNADATDAFTATVEASDHTSGYRQVKLDAAGKAQAENLVTQALFRESFQVSAGKSKVPYNFKYGVGAVRLNPALRLRLTGGAITDKEVQVMKLYMDERSDGHLRVVSMLVTDLQKADGSGAATTDPFYTAFDTGTIANGTAVTCSLRIVRQREEDDGSGPELFLSAVNPAAFWKDICDGYFSRLYQSEDDRPGGKSVGDPIWAIPYNSTKFSDLTSPASGREALPTSYWRLGKEMNALEFIEKHICQPYGLGYRFKPDGTGTPTCRLEPLDLRIPNASLLGAVPALTDADLDLSDPPSWEASAADALTDIRVNFFTDSVLDAADVAALKKRIPDVPTSRIESIPQFYEELVAGRAIDLGRRALKIEALGIRGAEDPSDTEQGVQRDPWAYFAAKRCVDHYRQLFGNGPVRVKFRARRTANTTSLWQGDWCTADLSVFPNLSTNQRGGSRLYLVLGRTESGPWIDFEALESGISSGTTAPTIGTPTQTAGYTKHSVDCVVTLNGSGDWVELRVAVKDTSFGASAPGDNDASWVPVQLVKATGTVVINNLPSGKRVFVAGRSVAKVNKDGTLRKLPSAWTTPAGTKYVDTASYSAPSAVTIAPAVVLNTSTVTGTWTNGESTLPVEVVLNNGTTDRLIDRYPAGSVGPVTLNPYLAASGSYTLKVRHLDALGGATAYATAAFTTPGGFTGPALTTPTLTILQGG